MAPLLCIASLAASSTASADDAPLLVRACNFLVPPSTGPVTHVVVKNPRGIGFSGTLRVVWPDGWEVTPDQHPLDLQPGEMTKLPFTIKSATNRADNAYPVQIRLEGDGDPVTVDQTVVCASAPYYKPEIDGDLAEWADAIPMELTTGARRATVRTYWSRRQFCVAVEVEEDRLIGLDEAPPEAGIDAVQFALSKPPEGVGAPNEDRYEFLVAALGGDEPTGKALLLREPGQNPQLAGQRRHLEGLEIEDAQVAVKRHGEVTSYEVSIPFALMPDIRPTPGRELCFSLLVHDPHGTGIRDLGEVMNLWEEHRQAGGWCSWEHATWGNVIPYFSAVEFGLCSSVE